MTHHDLFRQIKTATYGALLVGAVVGLLLLLSSVARGQSPEVGGRAGAGVGGFTIQEVSRGAYGLFGGPSMDLGRFRLRLEGYFMLAEKPSAEQARELGLCEDGSCQQLFAWGSAAAVYDVYASGETRVYLGGGADLGHHSGIYGTTGVIFSERWGIGIQAGPDQIFVSLFTFR